MITRSFYRLTWLSLMLLILISTALAVAATNTVPETGADEIIRPITANDLKPPECAGLNLTSVVVGSGTFNGGAGNSLILGSPGADTIRGQNGTDCILGGAGDDNLLGQNRNDVLLGGPGSDILNGGVGTDACYGGPDFDIFILCETQVQ